MVKKNKAGLERFRYSVEEKVEFYYTDERLVASTIPVWIQCSFGVLIGLFDKVGLHTNVDNMLAMVCQPGTISGRQYSCTWAVGDWQGGLPSHAEVL